MKKIYFFLTLISIQLCCAMDGSEQEPDGAASASSRTILSDDDISTQTDSDDELAQLAAHTASPDADPKTITRGLHLFGKKKKKSSRRASSAAPNDDDEPYGHVYASTSFNTGVGGGFVTHEASYDDVVRMIQSNSRFALSEARTLNRQYLDGILAQLQEGISCMQEAMTGDAKRVIELMSNLQQRLTDVEQLLPQVNRLLAQEDTIAQQYEQTCRELIEALSAHDEQAQDREERIQQTVALINSRLKTMDRTLHGISRTTGDISTKTREMHADVRMNRLKDMCARYGVTATVGGALAFLIMWFLGNDYTRDIEINDNLQEAA